jgi:hypothetical protein
MTRAPLPATLCADKIPAAQALAYICSRDSDVEAMQAKVLTKRSRRASQTSGIGDRKHRDDHTFTHDSLDRLSVDDCPLHSEFENVVI